MELHPEERLGSLTLEVEDDRGNQTFNRSELTPAGANSRVATHVFEVAETGSIQVRVRMEDQGKSVSDGEVQFQAKEDFRWSATVAFATKHPMEGYFGCIGADAFPVAEAFRTAPAESLWVWWGGKRKGSEAIF